MMMTALNLPDHGVEIRHEPEGDRVFDPVRRRWTSLPRVPETRGGTDSASVGPLVVSAGSESPAGTSAAVYAYDVRTRRWRRLPDLPTPRHGLGVGVYDGQIHVIGGGTSPACPRWRSHLRRCRADVIAIACGRSPSTQTQS